MIWSHPEKGQTIMGMVTNSSGIPLLSATITVESKDQRTTTDIDGSFTLDINLPANFPYPLLAMHQID